MKIQVLKDVNVVQENTADSLAVNIIEEEPATEYSDGPVKVTGDNLKIERVKTVYLGNLKERKALLEAELNEVQDLIDSVTPEVNKAIDEILAANPVEPIEEPIEEVIEEVVG